MACGIRIRKELKYILLLIFTNQPKDMARMIRAEVDESKMGEEEREYWGGGKECWCRFWLMIFWMRRMRQ